LRVVSPNILLITTDEERYPPPYETAEIAEFRRTQLPARERIRNGGRQCITTGRSPAGASRKVTQRRSFEQATTPHDHQPTGSPPSRSR